MAATIIISILLVILVALIIRKLIRDKKKGLSSCGKGCNGCPNSAICHKQ